MKNEIGNVYGQMTVMDRVSHRKVLCQCKCGNKKEVDLYNLKSGRVKGCGCLINNPDMVAKARERVLELRKSGVFYTGYDQSDEYTPFKYLFKCINNKNRRAKCEVTLEDLKELWEKQGGVCPYLGVKLILPTHANHSNEVTYLYASIDRIDSSQNYARDNIQFISRSLNYMKNDLSQADFKDLLSLLRSGVDEKKV